MRPWRIKTGSTINSKTQNKVIICLKKTTLALRENHRTSYDHKYPWLRPGGRGQVVASAPPPCPPVVYKLAVKQPEERGFSSDRHCCCCWDATWRRTSVNSRGPPGSPVRRRCETVLLFRRVSSPDTQQRTEGLCAAG